MASSKEKFFEAVGITDASAFTNVHKYFVIVAKSTVDYLNENKLTELP